METTQTYDFSVDKEHKTITVKREFDAPRNIVWDAYTKSEILDQWWAPKPWKAKTKEMDFRNGGRWLYVMTGPKGEEQWSTESYSDIEAWKKFTAEDAFSDADGKTDESMPQSTWEVSFSDKEGNKTLVTILIAFDDNKQLEELLNTGFKEGLAMGMENLDGLLPSLKK